MGASIVIEEVPAPHITSISPTKIGASTFDLTINGSNFDDKAIDRISWKATEKPVGQGTVLSQNSTQLVVREFMEGAEPGIYVVKVENPDGQISNGIDLEIINQPPVARFSMTSQGQTV
ncbi:MAG: IPT/TIG domain-containing protein, partial [Deltaproteobacteria bacterium]|nr:IPT/TIG domain-containing protein [Deltaproteobacteria bacterium]